MSSSNFFSKAAFSRAIRPLQNLTVTSARGEGVFEEDGVDHDRHHHIDSSVWSASLAFYRHHYDSRDGDGDWRCFKCAGDAANMLSKRDAVVSRLLIRCNWRRPLRSTLLRWRTQACSDSIVIQTVDGALVGPVGINSARHL